MGEYSGSRAELPKNIRQIGERDEVVRLYVEDYVNTYLKQVYPSGGPGLRVGLLLGNSDPQQEVPCLFVDGALEMEEVVPSGEKIVFSEAAWKKAYQRMEETFPKKTVQGWFICGAPGCMLSPLTYWRLHKQYFGGKNQLMYINSGVDGEAGILCDVGGRVLPFERISYILREKPDDAGLYDSAEGRPPGGDRHRRSGDPRFP